jgi:hypothetical protein
LGAHPAIEVLGSHKAERLPVVSFVVRDQQRYLHHNFVVAVLNDLFGVQVRGGCSCAGPYGHSLLNIDLERSQQFAALLEKGWEGIKPGWTRVSFSYTLDQPTTDYVISAIEFVAAHGWKLLPHYRFEPTTGRWIVRDWSGQPLPLDYFTVPDLPSAPPAWKQNLGQAHALVAEVETNPGEELHDSPCDPEFESMRWFTLPSEALHRLRTRDRPEGAIDGKAD